MLCARRQQSLRTMFGVWATHALPGRFVRGHLGRPLLPCQACGRFPRSTVAFYTLVALVQVIIPGIMEYPVTPSQMSAPNGEAGPEVVLDRRASASKDLRKSRRHLKTCIIEVIFYRSASSLFIFCFSSSQQLRSALIIFQLSFPSPGTEYSDADGKNF